MILIMMMEEKQDDDHGYDGEDRDDGNDEINGKENKKNILLMKKIKLIISKFYNRLKK